MINNGFGGSTLPDSIHFFERLVPPYKPRAIVVYAGDNDIGKGRSAGQVTADFKTLAGLAKESLPGVPLVYIAIKPSIKRWKRFTAGFSAGRFWISFSIRSHSSRG